MNKNIVMLVNIIYLKRRDILDLSSEKTEVNLQDISSY
jgi:hypothetical protein